MSILSAPHFHNEEAAYEFVEARVWPKGRVCPHCGVVDRSSKMQGKSTRIGAYKCYACRKPFTVKVGTIFEASHIKLHLWLQAIHLMCASKKGISSNQLHRTLGVTLKTAWFMSHRIREAMRPASLSPMGGTGGMVEVDETFIGRKKGARVRHGYEHKMKVLSLVDRETGRAHSMVVEKLNTKVVRKIVLENVDREARLMTDEARHYTKVGREFADHQVVRHADGEYGRGEAHTNTIEGFFSIFKRGRPHL
jgi:transposase-like protein